MMFSIVIVNYNYSNYLEKSICSVLNQNFNDFELIIIDGGSQDNSVDIIKKYEQQIDFWISEKDYGQSDALNKGFNRASGEYLFWLNSDDLLMPNSLLNANEYLKNNPYCKWLTFNTVVIDKNDKIIRVIRGPKWNSFLISNYGPQVDSATSIFHKSIYEKTLKFDLRLNYAMDIDMWLQFINLGVKYKRLNFYFYAFRVHNESKTTYNGYKTKPNKERIKQSILIKQKNGFTPSKLGVILARINKVLFCKPTSFVQSILWKGKSVYQIN